MDIPSFLRPVASSWSFGANLANRSMAIASSPELQDILWAPKRDGKRSLQWGYHIFGNYDSLLFFPFRSIKTQGYREKTSKVRVELTTKTKPFTGKHLG